jgi:hypothetical protein
MLQERFLQAEAAAKPSKFAIGCHNPVAGYEEDNGISAASLAYGPGTPWSPNQGGNVPVRGDVSRRDSSQCLPDLHLELATLEIKWVVQTFRFASEVTVQRIDGSGQRLRFFFNQDTIIQLLQPRKRSGNGLAANKVTGAHTFLGTRQKKWAPGRGELGVVN